MQGISVLTNPQGKPKTLTIDVEQHDDELTPFVKGLLDLLEQQEEKQERADFRAAAHAALNRAYGDDEPDYSDVPAREDTDRREFLYASGALANRAYDDDEPEYTDAHLIERNPNYRPK